MPSMINHASFARRLGAENAPTAGGSKIMRILRLWRFVMAAILVVGTAHAAEMSRDQALKALGRSEASERLAAVERLAEIGRMADADRLVGRLADADPQVRASAADAMWRIWSRSGDPAIDTLFARGVEQMQSSAFDDALVVFNEIVARKPQFAEGWNKRATLYFLLGRNQESLKDCDEVLKRNPNHFGALSGAGQIHLQLGNPQRALEFFQRALKVNPNLEGLRQMVPMLEQHLRENRRNTT
jgi:tetratricopeptide (TPR) repeat protein